MKLHNPAVKKARLILLSNSDYRQDQAAERKNTISYIRESEHESERERTNEKGRGRAQNNATHITPPQQRKNEELRASLTRLKLISKEK